MYARADSGGQPIRLDAEKLEWCGVLVWALAKDQQNGARLQVFLSSNASYIAPGGHRMAAMQLGRLRAGALEASSSSSQLCLPGARCWCAHRLERLRACASTSRTQPALALEPRPTNTPRTPSTSSSNGSFTGSGSTLVTTNSFDDVAGSTASALIQPETWASAGRRWSPDDIPGFSLATQRLSPARVEQVLQQLSPQLLQSLPLAALTARVHALADALGMYPERALAMIAARPACLSMEDTVAQCRAAAEALMPRLQAQSQQGQAASSDAAVWMQRFVAAASTQTSLLDLPPDDLSAKVRSLASHLDVDAASVVKMLGRADAASLHALLHTHESTLQQQMIDVQAVMDSRCDTGARALGSFLARRKAKIRRLLPV